MIADGRQVRPIDVGSFPLAVDFERYVRGAIDIERKNETEDSRYFVTTHNDAFLEKAMALGPNHAVAAYVQGRGMIDQFLLPIVRQVTGTELEQISITTSFGDISQADAQAVAASIAMGEQAIADYQVRFPEIIALENDAEVIGKKLDVKSISYKSCVTGPLELSLNLQRLAGFPRTYNETLVEYFTQIVISFVRKSVSDSQYLNLEVITLDEPAFGLEGFGDFFMDTSSDKNLEHLTSCWNEIYKNVPSNCYRGIHLHSSPFESVFNADWNLLEAHVGVYVKRQWLESYDRFIRAAIVRTDGPTIGKAEDVKKAWQNIFSGDYLQYLQSEEEMTHYMKETIDHYGIERVPFAGPECGFGPWDWKNGLIMATKTLERMQGVLTN
jgi:methionine synthase II (cobalamin-independent)